MDGNWELGGRKVSESLEKCLRCAGVFGVTQALFLALHSIGNISALCAALACDGLAFLEFFIVP